MKTLEQWFADYGVSHQNPKNRIIHKICVPLIFFTVIGLLTLIPGQFEFIRTGDVIVAAVLVWYLILSRKAFVVMLIQVAVAYILMDVLTQITNPLPVLIAIFVLAWIGQFIGHEIEGKKPSFIQDLQFLLIGPLWVVKGIFFKSTN